MAGPAKRTVGGKVRVLGALALFIAVVAGGPPGAQAQKTPPCVLTPQLRDVTVNQGIGAYTPLVNGKETLVRFYLSMPSCAGSGAAIRIMGATMTLSNGATGTISSPTPAISATAPPVIAAFTAAPMADSTGDPKFVVPAALVSKTDAFSANFATTISYQSKATRSGSFGTTQQVPFANRPGTTTPISASFAGPTNALSVLFVPMGDAMRTYSDQWTTTAQQALQDGMTAAVARQYPLPSGIGSLLPGATAGLRYMVAPTLLDLRRLNLIDANGRFCGTGASYDAIKAELAQFRLSHNTANPTAQANRVVGVIDPVVARVPPDPCFEGMAVVNSQEAWAVARPGKAGELIGLELAHTLGLTPPNRESPFDGAHSQNITAENPSLNRRYNLVQRSFITTDRSLMKPSGTNPVPDNINTLLEVPDFAFLLCVFGGPLIPECQTYGPGTVSANAPVAATLSFVMSGTTTGQAGLSPTSGTGTATGTSVVESYFASTVPQTAPLATSEYRLVQRPSAAGSILSNLGVPVAFRHSEHGSSSGSTDRLSGLFSFALPFDPNANRIELWKGAPGASGSLLLYAQDRTAPPQVTDLSVGSGPIILGAPPLRRAPSPKSATAAPSVAQADETLQAEAVVPSTPTTITPTSPFSSSVTFGNSFATISQICVTWFFVGDLFDEGELVSVGWQGGGGGGAQNLGGGPRRIQQNCMAPTDPSYTSLLDGTQGLTLNVEGGSVTVGAMIVSVTGDSVAPVGYRIASDAALYTVAQDNSVDVTTSVTDDPDATAPPSVVLSYRNFIPAGTFSTTPSSGTPSFTSNGTLSPSTSTTPGAYYLVVTATGEGFTRSYWVTVSVTAGGGGGGAQPGPTFTVNTGSDGTPVDAGCTTTECTLREAITAANGQAGNNTIEFDISGDTQIALQDPLPDITSPVLIDGLSQPEGTIVINGDGAGAEVNGLQLVTGSAGSEIRGLEIRDFFSGSGIAITSANNDIASNTIHSVSDGIVISGSAATGNVIGAGVGPGGLGSFDDGLGNVLVEADGSGLEILNGASGTVVAGNYIGTDRAGATTRGNDSSGIRVNAASNNQLGPGNTVARNGTIDTGIAIQSGSGNRIVANSIHHNLGKGISLVEGANADLRRPTLTSATFSGGSTTVTGTIGGLGVSDGQYFVEFFRNVACDSDGAGFGEGETYLTFATVTASGGTGSFSASVGGLSVGNVVTATLTRVAAPNDTSEFSNCVTVAESSLPDDQEPWSASASDADNIGDATLDGYLDCGDGVMQVIFVGKKPDSIQGNTAHWSGAIDTSLAEGGCQFKVAVMDQFNRPPITGTGTETVDNGPNTVIASVSSPRQGGSVLQYGLIPLRGLIMDAQGVIPAGQHEWTLTGPDGFTRSGTGTFRDEQPPAGGWPLGSGNSATYTATLTKPGSTEPSATDSLTFTVLRDGDNDGIPKTVEDSCLGGGDDDPTNFYADRDSDGIPNADDPQPCVAASSYSAIVELDPDPLPIPSNGNAVTASVRIPGRNVAQVLASTVRITRIAEYDVSTNNDFRNIGWTISSGVGTAKFDRQKLIAFLTTNNLRDRLVTITVGGRSGAPPWNFEGSDTIFIQG